MFDASAKSTILGGVSNCGCPHVTTANVAAAPTQATQISVCLVGMIVLLVLGASFLYYAEHEAQPDGFSSIPAAAWWGITTLTTVGYGDLAPVTPLGKLAASAVAILGIGLFALPAGILASAFIAQIGEAKSCPHCGKEI